MSSMMLRADRSAMIERRRRVSKWIDPTNANDEEALLLGSGSGVVKNTTTKLSVSPNLWTAPNPARCKRRDGTPEKFTKDFQTACPSHREGIEAAMRVMNLASVSILRDVGRDERGCESGGRVRGDG